uniref:hypothetical protein n=1 Tax=Pseudomonas viridiflava TaxID=33069 RepID=UPI00197FCDE8
WSQQDSGITLITSIGMIGVLEITLIVPTLRVGMPLRTLRVRYMRRRRCVFNNPFNDDPAIRSGHW